MQVYYDSMCQYFPLVQAAMYPARRMATAGAVPGGSRTDPPATESAATSATTASSCTHATSVTQQVPGGTTSSAAPIRSLVLGGATAGADVASPKAELAGTTEPALASDIPAAIAPPLPSVMPVRVPDLTAAMTAVAARTQVSSSLNATIAPSTPRTERCARSPQRSGQRTNSPPGSEHGTRSPPRSEQRARFPPHPGERSRSPPSPEDDPVLHDRRGVSPKTHIAADTSGTSFF